MDSIFIYKKNIQLHNSSHFEMSWNVPISPHKNHSRCPFSDADLPDGLVSSRNLGRISSRHGGAGFSERQSELGHDPRWKCLRCHAMNFCLCLRLCVCVSMVHVYIMYIDIGFEINLVKVCSLLVVFLCTSWDIAWQARPNSIETTPQGAIHGKMFLKLYVMLQVSTIHGCPVPIDPIVTSDFGWFLVFQTNSSPKWISTGRPFWAAPQPGAGLSPRLQKQNSHPQKPRHTSAATQFRGHNWAQPILADTRQDHRESICKVELDVDVSIDAKFNKHSAVGHNFSAIVYSSQEKGLPSTSHLPKIDVFIFYKVPSRILILSRFLNPTKKSYSVRATP